MSDYYLISFVLLLIGSIFVVYANAKVNNAYSECSKIENYHGYTGYQIARDILDKNNLEHIKINEIKGRLSDHYNSKNRTLNLSKGVYQGTSIASVAIAAHEVGHALQDAYDYKPLKLRQAIIPIYSIGSNLGYFMIIVGVLLGLFDLSLLGVALFSITLIFQLVTLPVEFDATNRALSILQSDYLYDHEIVHANKVLNAAAFTYVASTLTTLISILRLLLNILVRNRD